MKICNKIISVFVILTFLISNIAFAIPDKSNIEPPKKGEIVTNPDNIVVSRDFGLVKNKFNGNSGKLVIHIQDAHCNYEAQTNIVHILEALVKNYNLALVSVEGADGFIDTSWFKAFPDDQVRKEVADYFMKKGEITGPEFLSITTDLPFKLFGAETRSYYIQNLNAFTSSYPLKEETEKYFNSIKTVLGRLKGYIYSDELKALDNKVQDYEAKKLQFNDYVRFLQSAAERRQINIRSYENFFRLASVLIYEKKIDFNVTDKERSALIDDLSRAIAKDQLQQLVTQSISFKSGKMSSAEYYAYLKNLAAANSIDLSKKYPNLYNYIIYNAVYSKIENEKLFQDLKKIEIAVKEKLFQNDDQRTLEKLSRHIDILLGLINIKLMNGDFDYYQADKKEFASEYFEDFIKKKTVQYGLAYDITPPTDAVSQSIPKLEDFYSIAIKRDKALVDNTLSAMQKEKQSIAVLVTGGFHSEGIGKLLEKEGVSYMVVCPSITKDVPTPYIQILTNQRAPLEDILVGTAHAKEGMVAVPSRAQLISMPDSALKEYAEKLEGGEKLALAIGAVEEEWVDVTVKGAEGAATPVGRVNIQGVIEHLRRGTGASIAGIINELRRDLHQRCQKLQLSKIGAEHLLSLLEERLTSPDFKAVTERFEAEYNERLAAKAALEARRKGEGERKSPGTGKAGKGVLTFEQSERFNQVIRDSRAAGEAHDIPLPGIRQDLVMQTHDNLIERLDRAGLPINVHPGRGGYIDDAKTVSRGLVQFHLDSYFVDPNTPDYINSAELEVIGNHESYGHIDIFNFEEKSRNKEAGVITRDEWDTETRNNPVGYFAWQLWVDAGRPEKQAQEDFINKTLNEKLYQRFGLRCDVRNIEEKLARLADMKRIIIARTGEDVRNKEANLNELRNIVARSEGASRVMAIVNPGDKELVDNTIKGRAAGILRADGNVTVNTHEMATDRGQFLVILDTINEFGMNEDGVGLGILMPGQGKRMSPLTQTIGNWGIKPFMPMLVRSDEGSPWLSGAEASLYTWNLVAYHLRRMGFKGIAFKWGDEPQIASLLMSNINMDLSGADIVRFGARSLVTDDLAKNKEWLNADPDGNLTGWARRRGREALLRKLGVADSAPGKKDAKAMVHLGSPAFSYRFLRIAADVFKDVPAAAKLDVDGYLVEGLWLSDGEWDQELATDPGLQKLVDQCHAWKFDFRDKCRELRRKIEEEKRSPLQIKVVDFGESLYWGDIGQLPKVRASLHQVAERTVDGEYSRMLACIDKVNDKTVRRDRFGNLIVGECLYPDDGSVRNSVLIDAHIYGVCDIDDAVIVNSYLGDASISKGAIVWNSDIVYLVAGERAFSYNSHSERVVIKADWVHTSMPKDLNNVSRGMENWWANGKEAKLDSDPIYNQPVFDNPRPFQAQQVRMRQRARSPPEIEAEINNVIVQPLRERIKNIASAAGRDAGTAWLNPPTMSGRYQTSKKQFSRSTFGEQLVFGTSGIREIVKFLEDIKCTSIAKALASYFKVKNEPDSIAFASDLRPSSPRIIQDLIVGSLEMGRTVVNTGNVPTPALVNFGMHREEGAIPSEMVTASHCRAVPDDETKTQDESEMNGDKPNRTTGEVLKDDERFILKIVREFLELEFMMRESDSMFDADGRRKGEGRLSPAQAALIKRALELADSVTNKAASMYVQRYVDAFGQNTFDDTDQVDFIEHMAVGKRIIPEIFAKLGARINAKIQQTEWQRKFIVDTEDLQKPILDKVKEIAAENQRNGKPVKGIFATDGDSDRPALFEEDGTFIYGDKLGYLTCEYIRSLKTYRDGKTKFFAAVTATVGNAVIERLKALGFEVEVVKIGSPYVVKAMEDRRAKGDNVVCMGFERNGGFLLGSDITLDNGKILKALPTRDAVLPIIAAFSLAKSKPIEDDPAKKNGTIGQLVNNRFSGRYASHGWSGLIEANMSDENRWLEFVKGSLTDAELQDRSGMAAKRWPKLIEDLMKKGPGELPGLIAEAGVTDGAKQAFIKERINEVFRIKTIFDKYTANMGQAIMRSFSPHDLNIVEVAFNDDGSITYLTRDNISHDARPGQAIDGEDLAGHMNGIKASLENHFRAVNGFTGGIVKIGYLDGVRMFFRNRSDVSGQAQDVTEIVHMRPSGNMPQWRIYSEASTFKRATDITNYRFVVYSNIISEYLENKKKFEGMHIAPRTNDKMKETFRGVRRFDQPLTEEPSDWWKDDNWVTWNMKFGAQKEHGETEGIVFGKDNSSVTFIKTTTYDVTGDLKWLAAPGYAGNTLTRTNTISWNRNENTLTCEETWSDGRRISKTFEGHDAWLEIGRGLDKNIPMGKFQDMSFPVMSDKARDYFKGEGIEWFDIFDVSVESEFTSEAPMWRRNFNFDEAGVAAETRAPAAEKKSPGIYAVNAADEQTIPPEEMNKIVAEVLQEGPIIPEDIETNVDAQKSLLRHIKDKYLAAPGQIPEALTQQPFIPEVVTQQPLIKHVYSRIADIYNAVLARVKAERLETRVIAQEMTAQFLASQEVKGVTVNRDTGALTVPSSNDYKDRGKHDSTYMKLRGLVANALIAAQKLFARHQYETVYSMNHGVLPVPETLKRTAAYYNVSPDNYRIHDTFFPQANPLFPGSIQYQVTGAHYQANAFDIKYVTEGKGAQYLIKIDREASEKTGKVVVLDTIVQEMAPGKWVYALPGYIDIVVNEGALRFNDVSYELSPQEIGKLETDTGFKIDMDKDFYEKLPAKGMAHIFYMYNGEMRVALNPEVKAEGNLDIRVMPVGLFTMGGREVKAGLEELYAVNPGIVLSMMSLRYLETVNEKMPFAPAMIQAVGPEQIIVPESIDVLNNNVREAGIFFKKLGQEIDSGRPIAFLPNVICGKKDNKTWGVPVNASMILEGLGAKTKQEKEALATRLKIDLDDVVSELWIGADLEHPSMIDVGTAYSAPVYVLFCNYPQETFGEDHLKAFGPDLGLLIKHLNSARSLSVQNHAFTEGLIPLNEGSAAILGFNRDITPEDLEDELIHGNEGSLNSVVLIEGKPYLIPKGMAHAYGPVNVLEIKERSLGKSDAGRTNSIYDRLNTPKEGKALPSDWPIMRQNNPAKLAEAVGIDSGRTEKDVLTMAREAWQQTLKVMAENNMLKRAGPQDYESPVVDLRPEAAGGKLKGMMLEPGFVVERFEIQAGQTMPAEGLTFGKASIVMVQEGAVDLTTEEGALIATLKSKTEDRYRLNLAAYPSYNITAVQGQKAVVDVIYKPLQSEVLVKTGFDVLKPDLQTIRSTKIDLMVSAKAFRGGDENTPGSLKFEKDALARMSDHHTYLEAFNDIDALARILEKPEGVPVVLLTGKEAEQVKTKPGLARLMANIRMVILPDLSDNAEINKAGIPFIREIEAAGIKLAITTPEDIKGRTVRAAQLRELMSQLTGNKALDWDMLSDLIAATSPDPSVPPTYENRIAMLLKNLQVKLQPYKADEGVRERRQLLWSV